eukprot:NODE_350_length_2051_cov_69.273389_g344_i0.p1 GENE.NODE_350_length_2051_cov_69.273389_g344_i0~~NODE_350_length_2051_cov_69.273389_g344_i0.p1  ORF type:complete len:674 (+),score=138.85 NODE_350_length_2051_cov_69.273389_g344_i0:95-2023(+)
MQVRAAHDEQLNELRTEYREQLEEAEAMRRQQELDMQKQNRSAEERRVALLLDKQQAERQAQTDIRTARREGEKSGRDEADERVERVRDELKRRQEEHTKQAMELMEVAEAERERASQNELMNREQMHQVTTQLLAAMAKQKETMDAEQQRVLKLALEDIDKVHTAMWDQRHAFEDAMHVKDAEEAEKRQLISELEYQLRTKNETDAAYVQLQIELQQERSLMSTLVAQRMRDRLEWEEREKAHYRQLQAHLTPQFLVYAREVLPPPQVAQLRQEILDGASYASARRMPNDNHCGVDRHVTTTRVTRTTRTSSPPLALAPTALAVAGEAAIAPPLIPDPLLLNRSHSPLLRGHSPPPVPIEDVLRHCSPLRSRQPASPSEPKRTHATPPIRPPPEHPPAAFVTHVGTYVSPTEGRSPIVPHSIAASPHSRLPRQGGTTRVGPARNHSFAAAPVARATSPRAASPRAVVAPSPRRPYQDSTASQPHSPRGVSFNADVDAHDVTPRKLTRKATGKRSQFATARPTFLADDTGSSESGGEVPPSRANRRRRSRDVAVDADDERNNTPPPREDASPAARHSSPLSRRGEADAMLRTLNQHPVPVGLPSATGSSPHAHGLEHASLDQLLMRLEQPPVGQPRLDAGRL